MTESFDVVVLGGGVIGCASALRLAEAGAKVVVYERSAPGAEASSAAAGILGAQIEARAPGPATDLSLASRELWPGFAEKLRKGTGIDVEQRTCGVLELASDAAGLDAVASHAAWQTELGLTVERLDAEAVRAIEPALAGELAGGVRFVGDGRVDPPKLMRAVQVAASRAGVRFTTGTQARSVEHARGRVTGVSLDDGRAIAAAHVVVAAGSWSSLIGGLPIERLAVRPARGQIVELTTGAPLFRSVVFAPGCYFSPRDDGRLLVGSTLEFVGFRREVTARAVRDLLDAALRIAPALADAAIGRTWSGFRPATDSGRPLLGPAGVEGLVLATGHFRNGILLAPITAEIVHASVLGRPPPLDLAPFALAP